MVRFDPMTETEFQTYCERSIREYAAEHVRAGTYPAEGSVEKARAEFEKLLPQGVASPGNTLVWIVDEKTGTRVGWLWWADRPVGWFIYDVEILSEHRRRGHAQAAFRELERRAQAQRIASISLHVFGHNEGAIALYERLGYVTTHRMMSKAIQPPVP